MMFRYFYWKTIQKYWLRVLFFVTQKQLISPGLITKPHYFFSAYF